jgi:hypothetical protein
VTRVTSLADGRSARNRLYAIVAVGVAASIIGGYAVLDMAILARRLPVGGAASFPVPPSALREALYNGTGDNGVTYAIGAATFDGDAWTESGSNPVLTKGSGGAWDESGVKDPRVVHTGSGYVMFFAGYDSSTKFQIGRATASALTGPWTKYGSNPVIPTGSGGSDDEADCVAPVILYTGSAIAGHVWWMFYTGIDSGGATSTMLAHSDDGITWTKDGAIAELAGYAPGAVVYDGGTVYLFVHQNLRVHLWSASAPDDTFSEVAADIIEPRSEVGNVSPNLGANASAGTSSVTIVSGQGANLEVGEPVIIVDSNTEAEVRHVTSVASTSVGVTPALGHSYAPGDGAVLRSLGYTIRDCRSVLPAYEGGWEMFGTPFRALDGLSTPLPTVWEGTIRYTAPALEGPWTQDWATGLLFPLVNDGSWSGTAAENPSVIVTP